MNPITVQTNVNTTLEKTWNYFTLPEHITQWNQASEDWHCPKATNDLRVGGQFSFTMAAKNGEMTFDFNGIYTEIIPLTKIAYEMEDGRKVEIHFSDENGQTNVIETFEPENTNSEALQQQGWQAILENFRQYTEKN